ncbi:hypothetical protein K502DRAFT_365727 [Neoconidiobolus thromboides FSU 785]|nr:hypothetical protein K502DRAFT_365727 [Neoconidiobolus thromboides FSU 785]
MFKNLRLLNKLNLNYEYLYGYNSVISAISNSKRHVSKVYLLKSEPTTIRKKKQVLETENKREEIREFCEKKGVRVIESSRNEMNQMIKEVPTQGIIAYCEKLELNNIKGLSKVGINNSYTIDLKQTTLTKNENQRPLWLVLDRVYDPHNLGAIIRSASFFNISGIVISQDDSCKPNPTVHKCSSGTLEYNLPYLSRNLVKFLNECKKNHWSIVGTCLSNNSHSLFEMDKGNFKKPTMLVLGSEGNGISSNIQSICDELIYIPKLGQGLIDSLNVSVANGIILSYLQNCR